MVELFTDPLPVVPVMLFAIALVAVLFFMRIFISGHLMKMILSQRPIVLLIGPPNSGKHRLMKSMALDGTKIKTRFIPFVGRFRTCDIAIGAKIFRVVNFYAMRDERTLKDENIKLFGEKPRLIIFVLKDLSEQHEIEHQIMEFHSARDIFRNVPAVAVSGMKIGRNDSARTVRRMFGKDFVEIPMNEEGGLARLKERMSTALRSAK